jgi:DNA invertase Pin-like site-specific DNA recombinase
MTKLKASSAPAKTGADDLSVFTQFEQNGWRKKGLKKNIEPECALAYTRVSSKEQFLTNGSIETQLKLVNALSVSMKIPIEEHFGGTYESAKSEERKEFQRMMSFIAKSKKNIKYIFVSDHDRFSRTGGNAIHIASQLRLKQIQIVAASSPLNTLNPTGAFQQDLMLLMSAFDNHMRKEKCVRGMKQKYEKGLYFGRPPLGYDCIRVNGESKIVINEQGKLIAKAFKWKAEGKQTTVQITKRLNKLGFSITDKKMGWVFKNVFYCGLLNNKLLGAAVIEGANWEPLVSRQIFLKANIVLANNRTKFENRKEDEAIPLRHLIHCEKCRKPFTAYIVKKKRLYYYKCNTKGCKSNKSAKEVHSKFETLLDQFKIDPRYTSIVTKQLKQSFIKLDQSLKEKQGDHSNRKKQLQQKIVKWRSALSTKK